MKWFKHMTDMSEDVRIKRVIRKYGVIGYGLYNYIIERIVRRIDTESPQPDLEESATDIASDLGMDTVQVEEIMLFCMQQGLFEQDEVSGRLLAHKVYKFLQQSETRSQQIRDLITKYKSGDYAHENDCLRLSETNVKTRLDKTRLDIGTHASLGVPLNTTRYKNLCERYGQQPVDNAIQERMDWESSKGKPRSKDYAAAAANWLKNAERFGQTEHDDLPVHRATRNL